ncbi:hypothetical protein [Streptomyces sp. NBC_00483]|uniref:hypothetical protein n=1 Tax=Streptomyces sp. NBC_00483 TaxID=2975756 RepID=UPI002E18C9D4
MSLTFTIELPAGLPLLNANRRHHHRVRADRTRTLRAAAMQAATENPALMRMLAAAKPGALYQRARIVAYYRPARAGRADPANWYPSFKAAVDGLVDAGLLEDDDHTRLIGPDMRLGNKVPGGQLVLVISDATNWTDVPAPVTECQTPGYAEGPCHCAFHDPASGTDVRQCGHDDYHDAHPWADHPSIWCPGHSYESEAAA